MINSLYSKLMHSNRSFFSSHALKSEKSDAIILVDIQSVNIYFIISTMKFSKCVEQVMGGKLVVLNSLRANARITAIIASYLPSRILNAWYVFIKGFLLGFIPIMKAAASITTGDDLVSYRANGLPIGIHIYDYLLRRQGIPTIDTMSPSQRLCMIAEMSFFHCLYRYIHTNNIACVVLPDNAYRSGLIFEVLKKFGIKSLVGLDLNGVTIHDYKCQDDYQHHCRRPDHELIDRIVNSPELLRKADEYLAHRISGGEIQHDLIRAYACHKQNVSRGELIERYRLDPRKKIILVASHIFCDAPHAYPGMLFKDYQQWLVRTCLALGENSQVEFIVKEHPSVDLYHEQGIIKELLDSIGQGHRLLDANVNTKSLFESVDALVTCGGTAGMEFPCFGVPVVVAARPPYSHFSYVTSHDSQADYLATLSHIHELRKLSVEQMVLAKAVLYTINVIAKCNKSQAGLGSQGYCLGNNIDYTVFLNEMIADNEEGNGFATLKESLHALLDGSYHNLMGSNANI